MCGILGIRNKRGGINMKYMRKGKYSIEDVLSKAVLEKTDNYELFKAKGTKCICCGLEGKFFAKERKRNAKTFRLYLYGIDENGEEVMLTKDHIIPKSLGGENCLENYQTMCVRCNEEKKTMNEAEFNAYLDYKLLMSSCSKAILERTLDTIVMLLKCGVDFHETLGLEVTLGRQAQALRILIRKFE